MGLLDVQTINGTFNNVANPSWGSAAQPLLRKAPAAYSDGVRTVGGASRPSPRVISNAVCSNPPGGVTNSQDLSAMVYAWGQFLDHDLSLSESQVPTETMTFAVPAGDTTFDPSGSGSVVMTSSRSAYDAATGVAPGNPRQQVNSITAYIDGSQVYGSSLAVAASLRTFQKGLMKDGGNRLLPVDPVSGLFSAGDVRANENPELASLQVLFVREHNRLAMQISGAQPLLSDEEVYQQARRIVISLLQKVTFSEFLPALMGPAALPAYAGYRPSVNAAIANEFSTGAYRFGHSMLGSDLGFLDNLGRPVRAPLSLRDAFFGSQVLQTTGIDPVLKYLVTDRAQEIDTRVIDDVRNLLFTGPGSSGHDLASLNIQRGRDHGLASYNDARRAYALRPVSSFAEITPDVQLQASLRALYGSVENVDLWVGGLAELHLPGTSLGPTFTAIIREQFGRLRDGDRFFYRNVLPADALREVEGTSLADIIRRNTNVTNIQAESFFFKTWVSGVAFLDKNLDGTRQPVEALLKGATVSVLDAATHSVVASQKTDASGRFALKAQLEPGMYLLVAGGMPVPLSFTRGVVYDGVTVSVPPAFAAASAEISEVQGADEQRPGDGTRSSPTQLVIIIAGSACAVMLVAVVGALIVRRRRMRLDGGIAVVHAGSAVIATEPV